VSLLFLLITVGARRVCYCFCKAKPINNPVSHHQNNKFQCGRAEQKQKQSDHVSISLALFSSAVARCVNISVVLGSEV